MFDQVPLDTLFSIPQRNGLTKPRRLRGEGVKMVNMGELFSERRIQDIPMDRVPCSERELESNKLEKGDLLFARQSLTLAGAGQSSIFLGDQEDVVFESHLIRCRLDKSKVDPLYYFYFFESKFGKQRIGSIVEQVAAAGIRGSDLIKLPVFLPPLKQQKAIAHILGTLDDKIELNQKMNQTLEEIAKAIFKSWFVDFDPVRAKAEGRPTGLPPEISDLFPDELVNSEIGEIPKGWNVVPFECLVDFKNGYAFKSKELSSEIKTDFAVFKMGHIKVGGGFNETYKTDFLTSEISPKMKGSILKTGDVLMCMTDMKSNVRLLGHTALFFFQETEYLVNQRVGLIRAKEDASNYPFLYCLTNENKFLSEIRRNANSGVQVNLSTSGIKNTPTVYPGIEIMRKFGSLMIPIFERIFLSKRENKILSELRDTLLPKLISGELRIPDAENFLEEAGI